MYYALAAGILAVLERGWPGSMRGSADFVRCQSGLGLGFWRNFCISSAYPFPYLGNGWTDCAEILCVVRDQLSKRFAQIKSEIHLHVRTRDISGTAGGIVLKLVCV